MGREQSGTVSSDGGWNRSAGGGRPGEASDADVRDAVESAAGESRTGSIAAVDGTTAADAGVGVGVGDEVEVEGMHPVPDVDAGDDAGTTPDPTDGVAGASRVDHGTDPEVDTADTADATDAPPSATPTAAAVGVGIGLLTVGVLLVVYRTMLAAGAGQFVASLYGVGGLFVVGGFVAHAIRRADEFSL